MTERQYIAFLGVLVLPSLVAEIVNGFEARRVFFCLRGTAGQFGKCGLNLD